MKYIFEVRIKDGYTAEHYAEAWLKASAIIQRAPGALGTELHRNLGDPKILIAIAHWESKAARDAMEAQHNAEVADIIRGAAPCCDIRPLGEFADPEWVVSPSSG
ncbi:MAG: antibiotic biosynthesis monooxygenase [Idiomarina sp.]|nr:antibiotic biosynthesis monooxygenase [Idiomarina sp.]